MALYPPIIASSMPAFSSDSVRIYFTLSYNTISEVKSVHLTCRRQSSNVNVLTRNGELISILNYNKTNIYVDDLNLNRYYIELNGNNIIAKRLVEKQGDNYVENITPGFITNALYKIQLRFSSKEKDLETDDNYFYTNNIDFFSLWSTVCIIKQILEPDFYIIDFKEQTDETIETSINTPIADFIGVYKSNENSKEKEYLKAWKINLFDEEGNFLVSSNWNKVSINNYTEESGIVINCSLPYEFLNRKKYILTFEIQTYNDYYSKKTYNFVYNPVSIDALEGSLTVSMNELLGYFKILFNHTGTRNTNVALRRSDSKGNFKNWLDLKNFEVHGAGDYIYYDFTALSGIAYRYLVQARDTRGRRGEPLYDQTYDTASDPRPEHSGEKIKKASIAEWLNAFLLLYSTGNFINAELENPILDVKQLKLKYDFLLSSYKTNIYESKTDTIGGKYPYVRRNGDTYYRSFGVAGLITSYMDTADLFTSKNLLDNNYKDFYTEFTGLTTIGIDQKYDYTYERKFRLKVEEFLYNSKPKLYKSMQEGNIFIKLMEVSLAPKNELGRLVYTFSATAYLIDLPTILTYDKYGLINIGTYNPTITYTDTNIIGQLNSWDTNSGTNTRFFPAEQDIISLSKNPSANFTVDNNIYKKYHYGESINNVKVSDIKVRYIRILVESPPYLIEKDSNGKYIPVVDTGENPTNDYSDPSRSIELYQKQTFYNNNTKDIFLGHLFEINNEQIIIAPPNRFYELELDMINDITSLKPAKNTAMSIDYVVDLYKLDVSESPKMTLSRMTIGQIYGVFDSSREVIREINLRYNFKYSNSDELEVVKKLDLVIGLFIDTLKGTRILLTYSRSETPEIYIVNLTGILSIEPEDSDIKITRMIIYGILDSNNLGTYIPVDAFIFYTANVGRSVY